MLLVALNIINYDRRYSHSDCQFIAKQEEEEGNNQQRVIVDWRCASEVLGNYLGALKALNERDEISHAAILKFVLANHSYDSIQANQQLELALKNDVESKHCEQAKPYAAKDSIKFASGMMNIKKTNLKPDTIFSGTTKSVRSTSARRKRAKQIGTPSNNWSTISSAAATPVLSRPNWTWRSPTLPNRDWETSWNLQMR